MKFHKNISNIDSFISYNIKTSHFSIVLNFYFLLTKVKDI